MSDSFKQCFNKLKALGFLVGAQAESSMQRFEERWDSWEAHQGFSRELMLASLDGQRVWTQLSPGDELEILEHDGSRLWAGTLKASPKSWFAWLAPPKPAWPPPDIDPELWKSYFYRTPPLRAKYRSAEPTSL